jgi:signal transduction histidine kinase
MRNIFRIKSRLQHKFLRLIEASLLVPTIVVGGCLYYLILFLIADEIAIPEFIAVILYPAIERINIILLIVLPLVLIFLWMLGIVMSQRMAGPIDRLTRELDDIMKTRNYKRRIQVRKDDEMKPFVDNIDRLLAKIPEESD